VRQEENNKPRKMSLRWTEEEFLALDNKRHRERTTFQKIGERLFLGWLRGTLYTAEQKVSDKKNQENNFQIDETLTAHGTTIREEANRYRDEVAMLLSVLASGNTIAVEALRSNLLAFQELIRTPKHPVPGDAPNASAPSDAVDQAKPDEDIQRALAELAECSRRTDETLRKIEGELHQVRETAKRGKKTAR
jgi:hypothetical protein